MTGKVSPRKCPVCGSRDLRKAGVYGDQRQCQICGTTDQVSQFPFVPPFVAPEPWDEQARARQIDDTHLAVDYIPPPPVQDALRVIEEFFASRNAETWAFGKIQSRGESSVLENALRGEHTNGVLCAPTMDLNKVRALASAFRYDLMPRITPDRCEEIARKVCDRIGPGWVFADDAEKTQCFSLVRMVGNELLQGD